MNVGWRCNYCGFESRIMPGASSVVMKHIRDQHRVEFITGRFSMTSIQSMNEEEIAGDLYETYCVAVGGKAFNGDPLPGWKVFRADPSKQKQSDAWVAVARRAGELQRLAGSPG